MYQLLVECTFYHCLFVLQDINPDNIYFKDGFIRSQYKLEPHQRVICPVCHIQTGRGIYLKIRSDDELEKNQKPTHWAEGAVEETNMEPKITWQDVIDLADKVLVELAELMNTDPQHGVVYQQRMAVMMERKQQAIIMKQREELNG